MLPFLSKVFILGISLKLYYASVTEFCYKCDGFCTTPPTTEICNTSIDKNPVCMVKKDPVQKKETRSCLYPSTQSANITECNKTDDALCKVCKGNICNIPLKRKIKGPSRCYYCKGICKNPLETADCYYLQNICFTIIKSVEHDNNFGEKETKSFIIRDCGPVDVNKRRDAICEPYKNSPDTNCTVCTSSMCNRLPFDPPDPTPKPQLTANFANVFECNTILFEFAIYVLNFIVK